MYTSIQQWNLSRLVPSGHDWKMSWIPAWEYTGSFLSKRQDVQGNNPASSVRAEQTSGIGGDIHCDIGVGVIHDDIKR